MNINEYKLLSEKTQELSTAYLNISNLLNQLNEQEEELNAVYAENTDLTTQLINIERKMITRDDYTLQSSVYNFVINLLEKACEESKQKDSVDSLYEMQLAHAALHDLKQLEAKEIIIIEDDEEDQELSF